MQPHLDYASRLASTATVIPSRLLIIIPSTLDAEVNLQMEDKILSQVARGTLPPSLRLWISHECLVRGPHRSPKYGWYDEESSRRLGVKVLTRSSGGGVVYQDLGNLNWSLYLKKRASFTPPIALFTEGSSIIIKTLRRLGIPATFAPPNRIDVEGRKVSGMAAISRRDAILVHGTLLVSSNLDRLRVLCTTPPSYPPVANLREWHPSLTPADMVLEVLRTLGEIGITTMMTDSHG